MRHFEEQEQTIVDGDWKRRMADSDFMDDFDFGFEFADSDEITAPVEQEIKEERIDTIEEKLDLLLSQIQNGLVANSGNADELNVYKEMLEQQVSRKLQEVERLILPLLYNLKKNPDKEYIYWPNRTAKIDSQIQRILGVTRGSG